MCDDGVDIIFCCVMAFVKKLRFQVYVNSCVLGDNINKPIIDAAESDEQESDQLLPTHPAGPKFKECGQKEIQVSLLWNDVVVVVVVAKSN